MSHYQGSVPDTPHARSWKDTASCADRAVDAAIFHAGERNTEALRDARAVCSRCPVRTACLLAAYAEDDEWGMRAGLTPRQRKYFIRKADGNVPRAVADALEPTAALIRQIYFQYAEPIAGGHVLWTDRKQQIHVRGTSYTVNRLAWIAHHGIESRGHVKRTCEVEGCVAKACLTDQVPASRKKASV